MNAHQHYQQAIQLRNRIISGQSNERPVQAWAAVCRECAKASDAMRRELADRSFYSRLDLSFFNNLDRVWWYAKAQVETLAKEAGA